MKKSITKKATSLILPKHSLGNILPRIELLEKKKGYILSAEVPGIKEANIILTLSKNTIIIQGEKKSEVRANNKAQKMSEFIYGSFIRTVPLGGEIDDKKITAKCKNGILTIKMRKKSVLKEKIKNISVQ